MVLNVVTVLNGSEPESVILSVFCPSEDGKCRERRRRDEQRMPRSRAVFWIFFLLVRTLREGF
jgi:hypothetical protein